MLSLVIFGSFLSKWKKTPPEERLRDPLFVIKPPADSMFRVEEQSSNALFSPIASIVLPIYELFK
jgi:hypothetical protein